MNEMDTAGAGNAANAETATDADSNDFRSLWIQCRRDGCTTNYDCFGPRRPRSGEIGANLSGATGPPDDKMSQGQSGLRVKLLIDMGFFVAV
jgi:hypothetical protein